MTDKMQDIYELGWIVGYSVGTTFAIIAFIIGICIAKLLTL